MKKEIQTINGWWVRDGMESFLISMVYMNKKNAQLVCKGKNLNHDGTKQKRFRVVQVSIIFEE